ncbi:hypothetical protein AtNW77_Chr5g0116711 [Arabidopsis thaliana]
MENKYQQETLKIRFVSPLLPSFFTFPVKNITTTKRFFFFFFFSLPHLKRRRFNIFVLIFPTISHIPIFILTSHTPYNEILVTEY